MAFLLQVGKIVVLSGILILAAWAFEGLWRRRAGYRWRKAVWLVVALRLLLPFSLEGAAGLLPTVRVTVPLAAVREVSPRATVDGAALTGGLPESASKPEALLPFVAGAPGRTTTTPAATPAQALAALWAAGALGLLLLRLHQYQSFKRRLFAFSRPCEDEALNERMRRLCEEMGIRRALPIRSLDEDGHSPMIFGYARTALFLPNLPYAPDELDAVLRHELTHYRSGDLWYKLLISAVCDLYWFHPLLRLMKRMAFRDVEYVCDEKVTRGMDVSAKQRYSGILLKVIGRRGSVAFTTQFSGGKKRMKERFENIFSRHSRKSGIALLCAAVLALGVGSAVVTVSEGEAAESLPAAADVSAQADNIALVDAPADGLAQEGSDGAVPTDGSADVPAQADGTALVDASAGSPAQTGIDPLTLVVDSEAGADEATLDALRALYPDLNIVVSETEDAQAFLEIQPTVSLVGYGDALTLARMGRAADLTDALEQRGWLGEMNDALRATVSGEDGRVYGIPCPPPYAFALVANVPLFSQAGLVDETGAPLLPATWEELAQTARRIKEATGSAGLCLMSDEVLGAVQFWNIAWCFGADGFLTVTPEGAYQARLDSPEAVEAMAFVKSLKWDDGVLTDDPTSETFLTAYERLARGEVAMVIGANDALSFPVSYGMDAGDLALGALPAGPSGERHSFYAGSAFVLSPDASPEALDAALTLVELMGYGPVRNDASEARLREAVASQKELGAPVIRQIPVWQSEALLSFEDELLSEAGAANPALYQGFFDAVLTPGNLRFENVPYRSELCLALCDVLHQVMTDPDADVPALMKRANDLWQAALDS